MTASSFNALNAALFTRLSGGTALVTALGGTAIYPVERLINHGFAVEGQPQPIVIWSYAAANAENMTPNDSVNDVIYIRAYTATAKQGGTIDGLIASLMETSLTVTGWNNFWLAREEEIYMPQTDAAGKTTWSCGAYYRVRLD